MVFIIGGAYQGKLTYAKAAFHLSSEDIFTCTGTEIDFRKRCIRSIEEFTYACVQEKLDAVAYFAAHRAEWEHSILICRDIFCGVVPLGEDNRAWRQETGRLCRYLSAEAVQVIRIFCGLEQRLT